jgi:NitT/TauT family transport system substrate-binding protein
MISTRTRSAVIAAFLAIGGASPTLAVEKIKVSFAATSSNYSPYYIAIDKGYFREEGLDVEIVSAGGGTATPALIAGDLAFSTSGSSAVNPIMRGAALKVIFVLFDRPTYQIWTTRDDIRSVADLKGKSLGIQTRGDTFEIASRIALKQAGVDPNSVGYTPLGASSDTRMAAVKTGSLPATVLSAIDMQQMKDAGALDKGRMLLDMYQTVRIPYTGSATTDRMIKEHPERVKGYVRAVVKGMHYMRAYKDDSVDMTMKYNKATRNANSVDYDAVVVSMTKDGTVTEQTIRDDLEVRAGLLNMAEDKIPPPSKVYDFSFVEAVNKELAASGWKPAR